MSCCNLVLYPVYPFTSIAPIDRNICVGETTIISQPKTQKLPDASHPSLIAVSGSLQVVMPLTAAQVRNAITSNPWTKDFRHLEPFPLSYLKRYSFRDILVKAVKPQDRIKYWNIVPGDRVRVIGDKESKVLEVAKINKLSNRVYLKGLTSNVRACHHYSPRLSC
jgi:hypothetical protein